MFVLWWLLVFGLVSFMLLVLLLICVLFCVVFLVRVVGVCGCWLSVLGWRFGVRLRCCLMMFVWFVLWLVVWYVVSRVWCWLRC